MLEFSFEKIFFGFKFSKWQQHYESKRQFDRLSGNHKNDVTKKATVKLANWQNEQNEMVKLANWQNEQNETVKLANWQNEQNEMVKLANWQNEQNEKCLCRFSHSAHSGGRMKR